MKNKKTTELGNHVSKLDNCGVTYPDDVVSMVYRVEHSFTLTEHWVWNKMIHDEDVRIKNSIIS